MTFRKTFLVILLPAIFSSAYSHASDLKDKIEKLSMAIYDDIASSKASDQNLAEAAKHMQEALNLINDTNEQGRVSYRFRCEAVNVLWPKETQVLKVVSKSISGSNVSDLTTIYEFNACSALVSNLNQECASGRCVVNYCQPDNILWKSGASTMYEIKSVKDGFEVSAVDQFRTFNECVRFVNGNQ